MSGMMYVCGFLFDAPITDAKRVALVRKVNPAWQRGLLNGCGGRLEHGESAQHAMAREGQEELGVLPEWEAFCELGFGDRVRPLPRGGFTAQDGRIVFYRAFDPGAFDAASTRTPEEVVKRPIHSHYDESVPNLRWLIPMALDPQLQVRERPCLAIR
jgi:8-oxo-dGTP diphosphatase